MTSGNILSVIVCGWMAILGESFIILRLFKALRYTNGKGLLIHAYSFEQAKYTSTLPSILQAMTGMDDELVSFYKKDGNAT